MIWIFNPISNTFAFCSQAVENHLGYTPGEFAGLSPRDIFTLETEKTFRAGLAAMSGEGSVSDWLLLAAECLAKDGRAVRMDMEAVGQRDESGRLVAVIGVARQAANNPEAMECSRRGKDCGSVSGDVAEGRQACEDFRRKSEEQALLLDTMEAQAWYLVDVETYGLVNQAHADFVGVGREHLEHRRLMDCFPEDVARVCMEGNRRVFETRAGIQTEEWMPNSKGERRLLAITKTPKLTPEGVVDYVVCVGTDITERKLAEEGLRESRRRLADIIDFLPDATLGIDKDKRVIIWNKAIEEMTGVSAAEMIGRGDHAYTIPFYGEARPHLMDLVFDDEAEVAARYPNLQRSGETLIAEVYCPALYNGRGAWVYAKASPLHDQFGKVIGAIESIRDISEGKRAEEALRASEALLAAIVETAKDSIFVKDTSLRYRKANQGMASLLGMASEYIVGRTDSDLFGAELAPHIEAVDRRVLAGESVEEFTAKPVGGQARHFHTIKVPLRDSQGEIVGLCGIARDVTSQKRAEEEKEKLEAQLRQAQKMEAVGTLAGGVAHDFNNLLQGIIGYADILLRKKKTSDPEYSSLEAIQKAGERAAVLVRQLLLFSRKEEQGQRPVDLNREVQQARSRLERAIPKMIDIEIRSGSRLRTVNANPVQLEQILLNLGTNAADAMVKGGRLVIETANVNLDDEYARNHLGARPGQYVLLTVSDTGQGMDQETVRNIFDPYFTTKGLGKGTGLGLASVYGMVKSHDGYIACDSQIGQGTTFRIYLPALAVTDTYQEEQHVPEPGPCGNETILVVDDEESIREFASRILMEFGYRVLTAAGGEEALELYSGRSQAIDLVIMDIGLPGLGGQSCLEKLKRINPEAKVLAASGYPINHLATKALAAGADGYLAKPYSLVELLNKVRSVMDLEKTT
jgi:PAS domain S-box-containing protein